MITRCSFNNTTSRTVTSGVRTSDECASTSRTSRRRRRSASATRPSARPPT
ncbi:MAG: hypothetical protein IPN17_14230 [Deltaproteobacteria bacterium]|nr:hypothetical protein [Deltaproteobacteria bacterium]